MRTCVLVALTLCTVVSGAWAKAPNPAEAAHQAGEPSLQEILDKLGYDVDTTKDEIPAPLFVQAGPGRVEHKPIAAFGLPQVCSSGWYRPGTAPPVKTMLWQVAAPHNKQYSPPLAPGGQTFFNPGAGAFGVWVSTAGFKDETIYTEDALQKLAPRFHPDDRHKAHVFPAKRQGKVIPNTYIIGWEYSTNNDDQDMVTLLTNVRPLKTG